MGYYDEHIQYEEPPSVTDDAVAGILAIAEARGASPDSIQFDQDRKLFSFCTTDSVLVHIPVRLAERKAQLDQAERRRRARGNLSSLAEGTPADPPRTYATLMKSAGDHSAQTRRGEIERRYGPVDAVSFPTGETLYRTSTGELVPIHDKRRVIDAETPTSREQDARHRVMEARRAVAEHERMARSVWLMWAANTVAVASASAICTSAFGLWALIGGVLVLVVSGNVAALHMAPSVRARRDHLRGELERADSEHTAALLRLDHHDQT